MGTMVRIDEALLARASEMTGVCEAEAVIEQALRHLIAHRAALSLIARGGSDPHGWAPNEGDEPPM